MIFSSFGFALLFLPAAILLYHLIALSPFHRLRLPVLIGATLVFYAVGAARWLPLLLASVVLNYLCALAIARTHGQAKRALLWLGVGANVGALLAFKYTVFVADNIAALLGTQSGIAPIALPLALSFYSFQQIAFLVDTSRGMVSAAHPLRYAASILFFPILIAGPITLYRQLDPQLAERPVARAVPANLLIGLTLFSIGLFKKTVIADSLALWVDPLFAAASAGHAFGVASAWGTAVAYFLQIYFDFSGYSDMAMGCARMLGILIPLNFFSPLRSTSVIEYWRRWHMTLGRFVNAYIFTPLSIPLTRWAATHTSGKWPALIIGTLVPTFITMLVIGTWHGGNWTFVVFGLLHGTYMVIAEAWTFARRKKRKGKPVLWRHRAFGNALTIVAVLIAMVPFRAPDMTTAAHLWTAMAGFGGAGAPLLWPHFASLGGVALLLAIIPCVLIVYLLPNSAQIMARIEPALEWDRWTAVSPPVIRFGWRPTTGWAVAAGVALMLGRAFIARGSASFVYFDF